MSLFQFHCCNNSINFSTAATWFPFCFIQILLQIPSLFRISNFPTDGNFSFMVYFIIYWWRTVVFTEHSSGFVNCLIVSSIVLLSVLLVFSHCRVWGLKNLHFVRLFLPSSNRVTHKSHIIEVENFLTYAVTWLKFGLALLSLYSRKISNTSSDSIFIFL